jgi:hypothetical protein
VFGDQAVRRLAANARKDLNRRVEDLIDSERNRYLEVLDELAIEPGTAEKLREESRRIDDLRFAAQLAPTATEESSLHDITTDDAVEGRG